MLINRNSDVTGRTQLIGEKDSNAILIYLNENYNKNWGGNLILKRKNKEELPGIKLKQIYFLFQYLRINFILNA